MKTRSVLECGGWRGRGLTPLLKRPTPTNAKAACAPTPHPPHSKTWRRSLAAFFILQFAFCLQVWGQSYSIDWFTIDGGGSMSTGGVYSVTGTIGQPDAGTMSGGTYTLNGGFWGVIAAVQTEGAPLLSITLNSQLSTITVSWPSPATGWLLHATTNLVTGRSLWTEIPAPYQTNGANLQFTEAAPVGNKFYRLHNP